jgi:Leucine-rich repeat (LRR) protein
MKINQTEKVIKKSDNSWMVKLREWADENNIGTQIPRDENTLLQLTKLDLNSNKLKVLPKEIGNLPLVKIIN